MSDSQHRIEVHCLPQLVNRESLRGETAVVIDVLRATTTIAHALAAGARTVIPCTDIAEARQIAASCPPGEAIIGGERGGLRIEGFDLGNSPAEYTHDSVGGKTVVFTTSNGTPAMECCREAKRIFLGAFVNLTPLVEVLRSEHAIHLVCAGTDGEVTFEDVLLAGAVIDRLLQSLGAACELNDQARLASICFQQTGGSGIQSLLEMSHGGSHLRALGMASDIALAAAIDAAPVVPELDASTWRITLAYG